MIRASRWRGWVVPLTRRLKFGRLNPGSGSAARRSPGQGHHPPPPSLRRPKRELNLGPRKSLLQPDPPPVRLDDGAGNRQPQAGAVLFAGRVAAVEGVEDVVLVGAGD